MALVYGDDLLLTGANEKVIFSLKQDLDITFTIKDLGKVKFFLGLELFHDSTGLRVHQHKYILDIFYSAGLTSCRLAKIPIPTNVHLIRKQGIYYQIQIFFKKM